MHVNVLKTIKNLTHLFNYVQKHRKNLVKYLEGRAYTIKKSINNDL